MAAAGHFADDQVESILIQSRDGGSPAADEVAQIGTIGTAQRMFVTQYTGP